MNPKILITGATGATGRGVVQALLKGGLPVRAFVHSEDERSHLLSHEGADIAVGDLLDFHAVRRALDGVQRAYFVYPIVPGIAQATVQFAQAAREVGVDLIVNMSQKSARREAKSDAALQHWLSERIFDWSGVPVTHLRPTYFAEWLLYMHNMIREGRISVPFGPAGRHAPIAAEDLAAVIAAILTAPDEHRGQTYPLFGPIELTLPEIAAIVGRTLGKTIRYEKIPADQWAREIGARNAPFLAQHLGEVAIDHDDGIFAGTNDVIERITGRPPMNVAAFVEKHRTAFE